MKTISSKKKTAKRSSVKRTTNKRTINKRTVNKRTARKRTPNKSVGKQFVYGFVKSFLFMFFIISLGVLSYQSVTKFLNIPDSEEVNPADPIREPKVITEASIDDVSKNLIYSIDDKTGTIDKLLLEIFHCGNKEMHYITIPLRTQFTMSDSLYKKLILVQPAIPQIMKLSNISKYFSEETAYEYGVLLIEDLLDIKLSYYTVIPSDKYKTMFTTEKIVPEQKEEQTEESEHPEHPIEIFSKDYREFLSTIKTAEDLSNYIEESYQSVASNLTLEGKMNYLESYCRTSLSSVFFDLIAGDDNNSAYVINEALVEKQIRNIMMNNSIKPEK